MPGADGHGPGHSLLLALKAEALLGLQLVTRHRAPRLTAILGLALVAGAAVLPSGQTSNGSVLLVGSTLAVIGASRLLAGGPALAAARMVAARWWVVPVGRLAGALCAVVPFALGVAALMVGPHGGTGLGRIAWATCGYAAALIACTMAMASFFGASAAATFAFLAVWLGVAPPSAVSEALESWPVLQRAAVWMWNALPLPWRALRWLAGGPPADPLLVIAWTLIGVTLAGWRLSFPSRGRASSGSVL
jgi:hypothetical protein